MSAVAAVALGVAVLLLWRRPHHGAGRRRLMVGVGPPGVGGVRARGRSRRDPGRADPGPPDEAVLLDLVATALAAGVAVPVALDAVGEAVGTADGDALRRVGAALVLGTPWDDAWAATTAPRTLAAALEPAWEDGVAAEPLLARAAARVRAERGTRAREAAARLSARLVLPLGLCLLPSFVLLGLVPVVLGTGRGLLG